jgi:hypothetical protein
MHPWLPPDQQSTILNVSVAAQHPRYAMTALALGDQQIWVNYLDRPVGEARESAFRPRTFRWCSNSRSRPAFAIFCAAGGAVS